VLIRVYFNLKYCNSLFCIIKANIISWIKIFAILFTYIMYIIHIYFTLTFDRCLKFLKISNISKTPNKLQGISSTHDFDETPWICFNRGQGYETAVLNKNNVWDVITQLRSRAIHCFRKVLSNFFFIFLNAKYCLSFF
jgi:hypothetical protein